MPGDEVLSIGSFDELLRHEPEILRRVNAMPNGGRLLLIDPLRLLSDVGVQLGERAVAEWRAHGGDDVLDGTRDRVAYEAILASGGGSVTFDIRRLVERS
jgi:hypothetical protein